MSAVAYEEMPLAPDDLFSQVRLLRAGMTPWGTPPPLMAPGIYVISHSADPTCCQGAPAPAISSPAVASWLGRVPAMRFDGAIPRPHDVAEFIAAFWHADESIVYIGKAASLRNRLRQFFSHTLGSASPHKGGHWLKTLTNIEDFWIHFAACSSASEAHAVEIAALDAFQQHVLSYSPGLAATPTCAIPFANRKHRGLKQNRLSRETL